MKEKKIFIQMGVTIDLDNEELEDFLTYLPEKLTGFVTNEDSVLEDELYDEDVKILDEKGDIFSASVGALLAKAEHNEEKEESKTKDIKTVTIELKDGSDPLHGTNWGFEEVNGMVELSEILPKKGIVPSNERKRTYFVPLENISFVEVIDPIK